MKKTLSIIFLIAMFLRPGMAEEKTSKRTEALLKQVNEQYQHDLDAARKKHTADVIMGDHWGELNAKDDIRFQLVRVYVEKEEYAKALSVLTDIIEQSPDIKARMRAWLTRGTIVEIGLNKPKDALKEYRQAILVPGNKYVDLTAGAYLAMAEIYSNLNDRKRAILILEESYRSLTYTTVQPVPMAEELIETER